MKKRASLVEHPFGSLKLWLGWTHFLMRGLDKVRAEMNLLMLSYNFKRVLNILGIDAFREYCLMRRAGEPAKNTGDLFLFFFLARFMTVICALFSRLNRNIQARVLDLKMVWCRPRKLKTGIG